MRAGKLVAVYVDDALGRRLVLADESAGGLTLERVLVLGTTQTDVRAVIVTLTQLLEELPP